MCEVEDLAEMYKGLYRVVSNKDNRDRHVEVMNQVGEESLVFIIQDHRGDRHRAAILPEDARQFAIGLLYLLEGKKPVVKDAWSPEEASTDKWSDTGG